MYSVVNEKNTLTSREISLGRLTAGSMFERYELLSFVQCGELFSQNVRVDNTLENRYLQQIKLLNDCERIRFDVDSDK